MNKIEKVGLIKLGLVVFGVLSAFFSGYFITMAENFGFFLLSFLLLFCSVVLSSVEVTPEVSKE